MRNDWEHKESDANYEKSLGQMLVDAIVKCSETS